MFWENIYYLFVIVTCVLGISTFLQWIVVKVLTPKKGPKAVLILPLTAEKDDVELVLRSTELRARLMGSKLCDEIIAVDCGMDEETREICKTTCEVLGSIRLCKKDELMEIVATETA